MTVTLPALVLMLNPRGGRGRSVYILSPCRPFMQSLLKIWQYLPPPQPLLVFTVRSYRDLSSWHWNPVLCHSGLGLRMLHSQSTPPNFYPPHVNLGLPILLQPPLHVTLCLFASPSQLHISAPPTLLDECGFFKSLVVGHYYSSILGQFWMLFVLRLVVILLVVAQGSEVCLPTPPS